MRTIKFRAWYPDCKEMSEPFGVWKMNHRWVSFPCPNEEGRPIWIQYTGLKDKNGKEIYEGDIVENIKYKKQGTIIFRNGGFEIDNNDIHFIHSKEIKVIGNIYENPELIN